MSHRCPTRTDLVINFQKATEEYSRAVFELSRGIGAASKTECDDLVSASENAGFLSESARLELEDHIKNHGCDELSPRHIRSVFRLNLSDQTNESDMPKLPEKYARLIEQFPLRPIRNDDDLKRAIRVLHPLVATEELSADESDYLEVLSRLIEDYESKASGLTR